MIAIMVLNFCNYLCAGQVKEVSLVLVGDIMLGRLVDKMSLDVSDEFIWGDTISLLRNADISLGNLENVFTKSSEKVAKVFNFKAQPSQIRFLKSAHFTVLNMANNHSLDFSVTGLLETVSLLDDAGILHVGAGKNAELARAGTVITRHGCRVGILGVTDNEPCWDAGKNKPGIFYINTANAHARSKFCSFVAEFKKKHKLDMFILSIHWGPNMRLRPSKVFRRFAHQLIDAGVDILHGHSAHVVQGMEWYHNRLICYDTGDFVDDYAIDPELRNDLGVLVRVSWQNKSIKCIEIIPTIIKNCQVNKATGEDFKFLSQRLQNLSGEFGTAVAIDQIKHRLLLVRTEGLTFAREN